MSKPRPDRLLSGVVWSEIDSLPPDWNLVSLESELDVLTGNSFDSDNFVEEGGIPLIRIRDLGTGDTTANYSGKIPSKYLVDKGSLLVGMDGEFRPYLWSGEEAALNQRVCKLTPQEKHNQIFFRYALEKPLRYTQASIAGTTVKHLSQGDIRNINLPTPVLDEQVAIASVLSTVDKLIQNATETIEQLQIIKQGIRKQLIGEADFQQAALGELFGRFESGNTPSTNQDDYYGGDIPFIKIGDLPEGTGEINSTELTVTQNAIEENGTKLFEAGDLLVSIYGSVGKTYTLRSDAAINQAIIGLSEPKGCSIEYIRHCIEEQQPHLESLSQGNAQQNIGKGILMNYRIPLPEMEIQRDIVEKLASVESRIRSMQDELAEYESIKMGLMQDLLTGDVRTNDKDFEILDEVLEAEA